MWRGMQLLLRRKLRRSDRIVPQRSDLLQLFVLASSSVLLLGHGVQLTESDGFGKVGVIVAVIVVVVADISGRSHRFVVGWCLAT